MLIPAENSRELKEIPKNIKQNLDIRPVRWIDEVLQVALTHMPEPLSKEQVAGKGVKQDDASKDQKSDTLRPH